MAIEAFLIASSSFGFLSDAKKNYLAAFEIVAHETLNKNHIAEVLVNLGSVNFNMQNYAESKLHLEEALELSKQYGFKDIIRDSYSLYVKLDSIQGDYRNALIHYKLYVLYKDSLSSEENTKKVTRTKLKYESEEREQQITLLTKESKLQQTELQKQNTTLNALIIACLLIALLAGIIYNRNRIKHNANAAIENTMQNLKATQEQLVEHEKLASLGKFTADVAREIEVPVKQINQLTKLNRTLILNIKKNSSIVDADALKNNLQHIYNYGKEADAVVKKVLTETRKVQS